MSRVPHDENVHTLSNFVNAGFVGCHQIPKAHSLIDGNGQCDLAGRMYRD